MFQQSISRNKHHPRSQKSFQMKLKNSKRIPCRRRKLRPLKKPRSRNLKPRQDNWEMKLMLSLSKRSLLLNLSLNKLKISTSKSWRRLEAETSQRSALWECSRPCPSCWAWANLSSAISNNWAHLIQMGSLPKPRKSYWPDQMNWSDKLSHMTLTKLTVTKSKRLEH